MNGLNEKLLRISELEKVAGVDRRKIHYYLERGLLDQPIRTGKTMAYYTQKHVQQLRSIKELREKGYPLFQIKHILEVKDRGLEKPKKMSKAMLDRRAQITGKAVELFSKVGYNNTKISDITGALGMSPGSFYIYFRSKKEIFLECVDQVFDAMFQDAIEEIRKERHPIRRLKLRAEIALKSHWQFFDILKLLEMDFNEDPLVREKRKKIYTTVKEALKRNLQWAVREGFFPPLNLDMVAYILIEILKTAQLISSLEEDFDVDEFLATVDALIFQKDR